MSIAAGVCLYGHAAAQPAELKHACARVRQLTGPFALALQPSNAERCRSSYPPRAQCEAIGNIAKPGGAIAAKMLQYSADRHGAGPRIRRRNGADTQTASRYHPRHRHELSASVRRRPLASWGPASSKSFAM